MIRKSFAKLLQTIPELTEVVVTDPGFVISGHSKPFATIGWVNQTGANWKLGDDYRQNDVTVSIGLYCRSLDEQMTLKNKLQMVLENSTGILENMGSPVSGLELYGLNDVLSTSDNLNYTANQEFDVTFVPNVYKNGVLENPLNYTVDYANGVITYLAPNLPTDTIRADFKCGIIEYNILGIVDAPLKGVEDKTHFYNTFFTVMSFIYVKRKNQRYY